MMLPIGVLSNFGRILTGLLFSVNADEFASTEGGIWADGDVVRGGVTGRAMSSMVSRVSRFVCPTPRSRN